VGINNEIREYFINKKFIKNNDELNDEDSILEKGVIDSVGMMELVSYIESTYKIKVDEDDLMPENFDSIAAIEIFITEKVG
jgi:acyl carrier protein